MNNEVLVAADVYFCVTQDHGVFLDLKRDAYSAVALAPGALTVEAGLEQHTVELFGAGLLTDDLAGSPLDRFESLKRPSEHLFNPFFQRGFGLTGEDAKRPALGASEWTRFFAACQTAAHSLTRRTLHQTVSAVRARKAATRAQELDLDRLRSDAAIFFRLRPWFPRSYLCLFDALALLEFLAARRLYPDWIFGVQAQPFGAHCWVQADKVLVNEGLEYANQFTPIMTV
jgi:hypothetical protein